MSKRITAILAALLLAVAMFVAGALGPFRPGVSRTAPSRNRVTSAPPSALSVTEDQGALEASIATLQSSLGSGSGGWKELASLGLAYLSKGRLSADPTYYPKAEAVLVRSLRRHPQGNFQARLGLGVLAAARHDFETALAWAREARRINPFNADALGVLTDALVELGRYESGAVVLQKMVDLRPSLTSFARVSYLRELHGDIDGAIEAMSTGLDYAGGSGPDAAWASFQLGELYYRSGRVDRAETEYRRGAYLAPDYSLPKVGLAKVAAARGHLGRATTLLSDVVKRLPTPEYVILLGDMYRAAGDHERAGQQYELVLAMQDLYRTNGVNTDIEDALLRADHGVDLADALTDARREWQRRRSVHVADALAWTLYANGRYEEAWRMSEWALRLGTREALFYFHAGRIALELDRRDLARRHLARALAINPQFSFLHARSARLSLERLGGER